MSHDGNFSYQILTLPIDLDLDNDEVPLKEWQLPRRNKFYVDLYEKEYNLFSATIRTSYDSWASKKLREKIRKFVVERCGLIFNKQIPIHSIIGKHFW